MAKEKQEQTGAGDYYLRASTQHPARRYRIGRHDITAQCKKFELNEAEAAELRTAGPAKWVDVLSEKEAKADAKLFAKAKDGTPGFGQGVKEEV